MTGVDSAGCDTAVTSAEAWAVIVLLAFAWCAFSAAYAVAGWFDARDRRRL